MERQKKHKTRGQSLVEVAISFPIILLILSGLLDLGRVYFMYIALEDAANEAAFFLAIHPNCRWVNDDGNNPECNDPNNAEYRAQNAGLEELDWSLSGVEIRVNRPTPYGIGDPIVVEIEYPYYIVTPVFQRLFTSGITLTARAQHLVINE